MKRPGLFIIIFSFLTVFTLNAVSPDCVNYIQVNKFGENGALAPGRGTFQLSDEVVSSFKGGQYATTVLEEDTVLTRVYGGTSSELGSYWSRTTYSSAGRAQQYLALPPGNTAESVVQIRVPAGTTIYEGKAAAAFGNLGGGNQVYIPWINPEWIVP